MADGTKIVVDHASKLFLEGTVVAFRNVELSVRSNEVLCIVGPSGCGKTTLLPLHRWAARTELRASLDRRETVSSPRPGVAIVFQHFGLLSWKTVVDNVAFGLKIAGMSRQQLAERVEHYIRHFVRAGCFEGWLTKRSAGAFLAIGLKHKS